MSNTSPSFTYTFHEVKACNMCKSTGSSQKKMGRRMNGSNGLSPRKKIGISTTIMRCKECGLIYSNPMPVPASLSQHYGMAANEYYSEGFLEIAEEGLSYKNELNFVAEFTDSLNGEIRNPKILDIGAGIGATLLKYKKAGFDIFGLEPSRSFYEKSKDFLGDSFTQMNCVQFEEAVYEDGFFDFIISFNVLEHVYDAEQLIITALKWLKPGGMLGIVVPYSGWLTAKIYNAYYRLRGTDFVTNISPMHSPHHLYEFGKRSFYKNAEINGYSIYKQNILNTSTHLPAAFDFILNPIMNITKTGLRLEVIIQKNKPVNQ